MKCLVCAMEQSGKGLATKPSDLSWFDLQDPHHTKKRQFLKVVCAHVKCSPWASMCIYHKTVNKI